MSTNIVVKSLLFVTRTGLCYVIASLVVSPSGSSALERTNMCESMSLCRREQDGKSQVNVSVLAFCAFKPIRSNLFQVLSFVIYDFST